MSHHAVTPETYAAWRYLEIGDELRTNERDEEELLKGDEELELLFNSTKANLSVTTTFLFFTSAELEESLTVENIENFYKHDLELQCFRQRSFARNLEQHRCENICLADLEARPEAYPEYGTKEDIQQLVEARRKDVKLAQWVTKIEEGQKDYAENVKRLAALDALIAKRRAREQHDGNDLNITHG
ncbi:hypothetical protein BC827DRAFT_1227936 [Russula dissimulans]|nr:hypothetical protein BC827DRAFT_1227936 [Russula dissimulans]